MRVRSWSPRRWRVGLHPTADPRRPSEKVFRGGLASSTPCDDSCQAWYLLLQSLAVQRAAHAHDEAVSARKRDVMLDSDLGNFLVEGPFLEEIRIVVEPFGLDLP